MRFAMAVVLAVGLNVAAKASENAAASNGGPFHGTWHLSSGEVDGKALSEAQLKGARLVIRESHYTVSLPDLGTVTGTQKLGTSEEARTIDITDDSGDRKGKTCLGIYELKGDEFRVVFAVPGGARPSKFETRPNSGQWMHVWKRIEK